MEEGSQESRTRLTDCLTLFGVKQHASKVVSKVGNQWRKQLMTCYALVTKYFDATIVFPLPQDGPSNNNG
jgi:hypothetical protein